MFVNEICCKEWNELKLPSTAGNGNILMQNHCHCEGETVTCVPCLNSIYMAMKCKCLVPSG